MLSVLIMSQRERIQLSREYAQPPLKDRGSAIVETESSQGGALEKPGAQVQAIQKRLCKHGLKAQPRLSGLKYIGKSPFCLFRSILFISVKEEEGEARATEEQPWNHLGAYQRH